MTRYNPLWFHGVFTFRNRVHLPAALRSPSFRIYIIGHWASTAGYQMLIMFSLGWLIFTLADGDTRYVGYMTAAVAVPGIFLSLYGGVIADKVNPSRLLGATQGISAVLAFVLALLVLFDEVNRWYALALAFSISVVQTLDIPTRLSILPLLIPRSAIPNAIALNSFVWAGTRIVSPSIAGIIVGQTDISVAIFISAAGFLVLSLISYWLKMPSVERATEGVFKEMSTGFSFIRKSPFLLSVIIMSWFTGFLGLSYIFLMPAFANDVLEVGAEKIGWLMGAAGVGAIVGILVFSNLGKMQTNAWSGLAGSFFFGVFLIIFAIVAHLKMYAVSIVVVFIAEIFQPIYVLSSLTIVQMLVPDQYRGRVMSLFGISWSLVILGGLQANLIAHYTSASVAVIIGGGLIMVVVLGMAIGNPYFRRSGAISEGIREQMAALTKSP